MILHLACDNDIHPPLFGATQRLFGLARGMATRLDVRTLCVVPYRSRGAQAERVMNFDIRRTRSWRTSLAWRLERAGLAPFFTIETWHRRRAAVYRALLGESPDVLVCDLSLTGHFPGARAALRVYHAHNVEAERWRSVAPRVWGREYWGAKLTELERRAVLVAENGYDETSIAPARAEARVRARAVLGIPTGAYVAAFVGGDWAPNHEALSWLVSDVMPKLASEGIVLLAVGAVARPLAGRRERWLVTRAETPDLGAILAAADAGLNPVKSGGGSNVKLPTYLAAGLGALTTPFGLRGHAPLAGAVAGVERAHFADALRRRPLGWAARGESAPPALAGHAWGAIGAKLAESLAARVIAAPAKREPGTHAERSSAGFR